MAFRAFMGDDFPEVMWQLWTPNRAATQAAGVAGERRDDVWVDITPWVRGANDSLGRGSDIGQPSAGVSTLTIDNRQSLFTPSYGHADYYTDQGPWNAGDNDNAWIVADYEELTSRNVDFDDGTTSYWTPGSGVTLSHEPDDDWEGNPDSGCLKTTWSTDGAKEAYQQISAGTMWQVTQNDPVLFSGWAKAIGYYSEGNQQVAFEAYQYTDAAALLGGLGEGTRFTLSPGVWTRLWEEYRPTNASCGRLRMDLNIPDPPGTLGRTVLWDHLRCHRLTGLWQDPAGEGSGVEMMPTAEQWFGGESGAEASIRVEFDGASAQGPWMTYGVTPTTSGGGALKSAYIAVYIPSTWSDASKVPGLSLANFGSTGVNGGASLNVSADMTIRDQWQIIGTTWTHSGSDGTGTAAVFVTGGSPSASDTLYIGGLMAFDGPSGPFWPHMRPGGRIRCLARWPQGDTGETFPVFEHTIESIDVQPNGPNDEVVVVQAVDASKSLNLATLDRAYEGKVKHDGATGYWQMSTVDWAGTEWESPNEIDGGNAMRLQDNISWYQDGAIADTGNKAMLLNGAGPVATSVNDHDAIDVGDGPFTIELWLAPAMDPEAAGANPYVISKGSNGPSVYVSSSNRITLGYGNGTHTLAAELREAWENVAVSDYNWDFQNVDWHHVMFTVDGSSQLGYLDGVNQTTQATTRTWANNTSGLVFGLQQVFIDELAIYKAALTADQVRDHYALGRGQFPAQMLHERVQLVLDVVGWTGGRVIDSSKTRLPAGPVGGGSCWSYIQQLAETEGGLAYIDGRGRVVFESRDHRIVNHGYENAVQNPGAEENSTNGWSTNMTLVASTEQAYKGSYSFKATTDGVLGWLLQSNVAGADDVQDVSGYTRYFTRVRLWIEDLWSDTSRIILYTRNWGTATTENTPAITIISSGNPENRPKNEWITVESPAWQPQDVNNDGYVGLYIPEAEASGTDIYVDEFEVRPWMATFSEGEYMQVTYRQNDQRVYNQAVVTPANGDPVSANDATSQSDYGIREWSLSSASGHEADARGRARQVINQYKDPVARLDGIVVRGSPVVADADLWPTLLRSHLGERVRVQRTSPGGVVLDEEYHIERVQHTWSGYRNVVVSLQLSPVVDDVNYWRLGAATMGQFRAGSSPRLGVH